MNDLTEKTLHTERKYTGKIISVDLLDIELPDGRKAKREVIRHGNAVAILARRPHGQEQDPDENVYPVILSEAEVEDGSRSGTIFDAKTLAAWTCYKIVR